MPTLLTDDRLIVSIPLETTGMLHVSYGPGGVELHYTHEPAGTDYTFPLGAPQCEVLETALRSARLACRRAT